MYQKLRLLVKNMGIRSLELKFSRVLIVILLIYLIIELKKDDNIIFEDSNGRVSSIDFRNKYESGVLIYKIIQKGDVLVLYTGTKDGPIRIFNTNEPFSITLRNESSSNFWMLTTKKK
ncbi:hypothetical protein TPENAI_30014 [Tenacibaculum litopenaei]|jgi:hypothetical protein|uniref:hypothetical protein n=1 Tax=Tenacibaculum litopenaei TaxID=396016 RepID=UPI003895FB36